MASVSHAGIRSEAGGDPGPVPWRDLVGLDDVRAAAERLRPVVLETPLQLSDRLSEQLRRIGVPEARGPPGGQVVQDPGRLQLHRRACARTAGCRGGVRQRRQPRPGGGLELPASGRARGRVPAPPDTAPEGGPDPGPGRGPGRAALRRRHLRRRQRRGRRLRRRSRGHGRTHLRPPHDGGRTGDRSPSRRSSSWAVPPMCSSSP